MLATAAAWDALALELRFAATGYGMAVVDLADTGWQGPSSASMAAAAVRYVQWMHATAAQAEQVGMQAGAAAAAYEAAFTAVVPPAVVTANRVLLAQLVAANVPAMGALTPAIMATEAEYVEFWAQDAAAMYAYASATQAASMLTPMTMAPATTNEVGLAGQAANGMSPISELNPSTSTMASSLQSGLGNSVALLGSTLGEGASELPELFSSGLGTAMGAPAASLSAPAAALMPAQQRELSLLGGMRAMPEAAAPAHLMPTAALGQATSVGRLSVPQSWATATPAGAPAAAAPDAAVSEAATTGSAPAAAPMLPRAMHSDQLGRTQPGAPGLPRMAVVPRSLVG